MSTTVTYKGNIIATVNNASATLETEGKYLEAKILLTDQTTPVLQTKSVTPTESAQTITPDIGYDGLGEVDVAAVSSTYVGTGVSRQAAQTIYPSSSDQSIAADKYLTGAQTIKGVTTTNLSAANIKKDVVVQVGDSADPDRIISVTGTYEGGGGGSSNVVVGSFTTGATAGATESVSIPYTGNGYPIALAVYVSGGSSSVSSTTKYTHISISAVKCNTSVSANYTGSTNDRYSVAYFYKNYSGTYDGSHFTQNTTMFRQNAFTPSQLAQIFAVRSKNTMEYLISNTTGYGLAPSTKYDYVFVYSE